MKTGLYFQDPEYQVGLGDVIRDPSLVLDLPLYELDGASFMSKDAYGHRCTNFGAIWRPQGTFFDGIDDYIDVPHHPRLDVPGTLECWLLLTGIPTTHCNIIDKDDGSTRLYSLQVRRSDMKLLALYWIGATTRFVESRTIIEFNKWYHAVATHDNSLACLYINANLDVTPLSAPGTVNTAPISVEIGRWTPTEPLPYHGLIGEVRIYNRALTPQEIQRNYLATKWRYR
jgi:hypothetical protein